MRVQRFRATLLQSALSHRRWLCAVHHYQLSEPALALGGEVAVVAVVVGRMAVVAAAVEGLAGQLLVGTVESHWRLLVQMPVFQALISTRHTSEVDTEEENGNNRGCCAERAHFPRSVIVLFGK